MPGDSPRGGPGADRHFVRPLGYPQRKRISYFQQAIWVAPPAPADEALPLSGTGEYFYLSNDSGTDLTDVSIRLWPCGALWKAYVSNPSGIVRADVRFTDRNGDVLIELARFPAESHFEMHIVTSGLFGQADRLYSNNENAILVPLNSHRIGMDADQSER